MDIVLSLTLDEILCLFGYLNTVYFLQKDSDKNLLTIIEKIQKIIDERQNI